MSADQVYQRGFAGIGPVGVDVVILQQRDLYIAHKNWLALVLRAAPC